MKWGYATLIKFKKSVAEVVQELICSDIQCLHIQLWTCWVEIENLNYFVCLSCKKEPPFQNRRHRLPVGNATRTRAWRIPVATSHSQTYIQCIWPPNFCRSCSAVHPVLSDDANGTRAICSCELRCGFSANFKSQKKIDVLHDDHSVCHSHAGLLCCWILEKFPRNEVLSNWYLVGRFCFLESKQSFSKLMKRVATLGQLGWRTPKTKPK